jgi:hypothetical protein
VLSFRSLLSELLESVRIKFQEELELSSKPGTNISHPRTKSLTGVLYEYLIASPNARSAKLKANEL